MPKLIKFAYVTPETLEVHLQGAESSKGKSKEANTSEDLFAPTSEALSTKPKDHLLHFQFNDGELRAANKAGKVTRKWTRKQKDGSVQAMDVAPTFSAQGMTKMIDRRNENFTLAVDELLVASEAQASHVSLIRASGKAHPIC